MAALGFRCGKDAVARMLRASATACRGWRGCWRESSTRTGMTSSGASTADRGVRGRGRPGGQRGREEEGAAGPLSPGRPAWRPKGDPVRVRDHDFPDEELGKITPYGVYDIAANTGFVSVGAGHDTAAFAVSALRLWWQREGSIRYPGARRLLVVCDACGSNSSRAGSGKTSSPPSRDRPGLEITVCHFPPGTIKWNKIEHRLFCHITRTWRARPLMTAADAVAGIAATTTYQGLKCTAALDGGRLPRRDQDQRSADEVPGRTRHRPARRPTASGTTPSAPPPPSRTRSRSPARTRP